MVANDTNGVSDVFLLDREADTIVRMSVGGAGQQGTQRHFQQQISDDGSTVVFSSRSDNLSVGDTNDKQDVFMSY